MLEVFMPEAVRIRCQIAALSACDQNACIFAAEFAHRGQQAGETPAPDSCIREFRGSGTSNVASGYEGSGLSAFVAAATFSPVQEAADRGHKKLDACVIFVRCHTVPSTRAGDRVFEGRRQRNKAENRAVILAAARRVFVELGYEAATVRDIIGSTDLASGTFYNYFRDKESVLRALLDEKMVEMSTRASRARSNAWTVEEVVQQTLDVAFAMIVEDREVFELLRRNAGAIRAVLDDPGFIENRDELSRDLAKAMRRGGLTGVDPDYLAAAIAGISFEIAAAAAGRGPAAIDAARRFAEALLLGGLSGLARSHAGAPKQAVRPLAAGTPPSRSQQIPAPAASAARRKSR